jgi:hypothetical protein
LVPASPAKINPGVVAFSNPDFVYTGQQLTEDRAIVNTKIARHAINSTSRTPWHSAGDTWLATAITVESMNLTEDLGNQFNHLLYRKVREFGAR